MNRLSCHQLRLASLVVCAALTACSAGKRASLTGSVSFEGELISQGAMRLFPQGDTPGDGAGATIAAGKYQIADGDGLFAGEYQVSITATRKTGGKITIAEAERAPGESATADEVVQFIPERYNLRTTLRVTLQPGENEENFELVP